VRQWVRLSGRLVVPGATRPALYRAHRATLWAMLWVQALARASVRWWALPWAPLSALLWVRMSDRSGALVAALQASFRERPETRWEMPSVQRLVLPWVPPWALKSAQRSVVPWGQRLV
jgi:hypothetical protein